MSYQISYKGMISLKKLAKKYNYTCWICKWQYPLEDLSRDHLIPKSLGGKGTYENIRLACRACNQGRGNKIY